MDTWRGKPDLAEHATLLPHAWLYANILILLCCLPLVIGFFFWRRQAGRDLAN
jgi:hypothetical protein